jgi:tRNA-uridine 2-sulfurtransferase
MNKNKGKRVIVGMSSGVDSSVAAAILKKRGYDVVGVFMHFWKEPSQNSLVENKCCSLEAQEDARKVCRILGIPLYTANVEQAFKKEVVDYFLEEYKNGRTPNPCVVCNEHIKFNALFKKMLGMKADYVASGHYARKLKFKVKSSKSKVIYKLYQGKDKEKDQSYFLYNFNQKQLARILFPIGDYKKAEIRKIAKKMSLPVFNKDESQGLCFTPEKYPEGFLRRNLKLKKGKTVNTQGKVIGTHEGLPLYTIGQRRGINIGGDGPYYVAGKDLKKNILVVTNNEKDPALFRLQMAVKKVNWMVKKLKNKSKVLVKTRYRNPPVSAIIKAQGNDYLIKFSKPQRAISPGQSAVFYTVKGELLGGGVIK